MMRFLLSIALTLSTAAAGAQDIHVRALDGKTGKPLTNQRLLVFQFHNVDNRHEFNLDLQTDDHGEAVLTADRIRGRFLQIWTDFMTDCVSDPNSNSLDVETVNAKGLVRGNTCSAKANFTAAPHELLIFARRPTPRERLAW